MAEASFTIECSTNPTPEQIQRVSEGLTRYNRSQIPDKGHVPILITLLAGDGSFAGGLSGHVSYGWLFIELLWVDERARSQGQGSRLMLAAEDEALKHGCRKAWVDTFSFQAKRFYEKLGYKVFGELEEYPPGHCRYFLRRELGISSPY